MTFEVLEPGKTVLKEADYTFIVKKKPERMTWIKPSFAWVLYRSGYGRKHNQTRVLKIKLSHQSVASLLSECKCKHGGGGSLGRVQWDPARDVLSSEGREPRKLTRGRAIQIGLKGRLNKLYVDSIISIEDVTELSHRVQKAHSQKTEVKVREEMEKLKEDLPLERPYLPQCTRETLVELKILSDECGKK
ncbi:uncharacterized protein LOC142345646 isoform X2 [Convolutriloba macropyga]|uniref:uncharacterized protein LOC142345646 isoform X2 n=1 Tax=Convolutriloba macropyga TaxID=536237 RepID=UPI003F51F81F